jgi:hypothetical protein
LSEEGVPSEQHVLENEDRLDFGVDILKDDSEGRSIQSDLEFKPLAQFSFSQRQFFTAGFRARRWWANILEAKQR